MKRAGGHTTLRALLRLVAVLALLPCISFAQAADGGASAEPGATLAEPTIAQTTVPVVPTALSALISNEDYQAWVAAASRAAKLSEIGSASLFSLERLRAELVTWRNRFLDAETVNSGRINTLGAQLASLGPAPDPGTVEDPALAARRAALTAELARLRAPGLLAAEAHAEASGLISELDSLLLARRTERIVTRTTSPLDPHNWSAAATVLINGLRAVWAETVAGVASDYKSGALKSALPGTILFSLAALLLLGRGGRWSIQLMNWVGGSTAHSRHVWLFVLSLMRILWPMLGLLAVVEALHTLDVFGYRGMRFVNALPIAGLYVVLAHWLARQFFRPQARRRLPIRFDEGDCKRGYDIVIGLGWTLATVTFILSFVGSDTPNSVRAVLILPIIMVVGLFLFRFGQLLAGRHKSGDPAKDYSDRVIELVGRGCRVLAVAGPLLAAVGYADAAEAILFPVVNTLAVLAGVILLQHFVADLLRLGRRARAAAATETDEDGLGPVLAGIALICAALPVMALIWGVSTAELLELWARFREGFSLGGTRISPTEFLTFALIFAAGFVATRLVQGTLRNTVFPKMHLDLGGQNAIVSGVGYVGLFLSGLIAITSAGIDLSGLAIVAGALSLGIGFGLQNIVSNFVSGIILLIERPISEGDWIEVGGHMGYVRDISVRSTRIETFDRTDVIIPNADLVSGQVVNWTRGNSIGRVIVPIGVAYGTDTALVDRILREIAEAHPMVEAVPPPNVVLHSFGADGIEFEIRAILRDVNYLLHVRSDINHEIAKRFAAEGIEIPFPQRDIWLRNPEALRGPGAAPDAASKGEAQDQ